MVDYLLNLTNHGVDIIRIDAVPYIWKELGTSCRNLPQVHNIVRMMRMICEIVCPGVLLLGEVVMEPSRVVPYFGTVEKPECHMLYNVTTMATTWHTVASKDVSLLKQQMDVVSRLPREYVFLNYLRCHDDIGWGLDYPRLRCQNMEETPHKRFLNDFFTGRYPGSFARGELLIDFASLSADEAGYPTMKANPGGAPGNFLAALNAYGAKTAFLGKVGQDTFGTLLVQTMEKAGIETRGIVADPDVFTTLAFVTFSPEGDRSFSFARKPGADTRLLFEELDLSLIEETRVFHFGTLSLTDEPVRTTTRRAVEYAKERGKLITFDSNLRLPLWKSAEAAREQILWGLTQADVVKISDEEVEFLWGITDAGEAASKLLEEYGVKLAMITLGPKGAYLANRTGAARVACFCHRSLCVGGSQLIDAAIRRNPQYSFHERGIGGFVVFDNTRTDDFEGF